MTCSMGRIEMTAWRPWGSLPAGRSITAIPRNTTNIADRIDTLTRGFLGLTVACARCHDHKYDPIPTTDYYALAGVFASTEYVEVPAAPREQVAAYDKAQATIQAKDKEIMSYFKAEAARLKQKVAGNQLKQIERMLPARIQGQSKSPAGRTGPTEERRSGQKYPVIHALAESSRSTDMPVLIRGNVDTPGPKVGRRFCRFLAAIKLRFNTGAAGSSSRVRSPSADNPLTARVMVNRIWQHHFGRGLVALVQQLRHAGRTAQPSRAARLAGSSLGRVRLVDQDDSPRDHAFRDLPAKQPV